MYLPQIFGLLASRCTCSGTELFNLPVSSADRTLPIVHSSILVLVFYLSAVSSDGLPTSARTYLDRRCAHMGKQANMRISDQARMDIRLLLIHVESDRKNPSRIQGVNQGVFIHDASSGGVDNNDAFLHLGKLFGGDNVSRLRLRGSKLVIHLMRVR